MKPVRTLYVCYFGLREPLVQTQVLPYLRQLKSENVRVSLLTFEPRLRENWTPAEISKQQAALSVEGITWHYLKYHKWPSLPATIYDMALGAWTILRITRQQNVSVLHARSHVAALMCAIAKRLRGGQLVFDIRGFMPEEYTDAGVWPANGYLYLGLKKVERYLLEVSDAFVVLTEKASEILFPGCSDTDDRGRPIEVIPCCVNFRGLFDAVEKIPRETLRNDLNLGGRRVIVYVGSFGGWYLTDEMTELMAEAHQQDSSTFSLVLTQSPRSRVVKRLRALGIDAGDFLVTGVSPEEVPRYLRAADIAVSFIKPCYSKQSSSPTKMAEYLASGLPVICNAGIGDLDELLETDRVGVLVREFTRESYARALDEITVLKATSDLAKHCRAVARKRFDLETVGGERYRRLYRRLLNKLTL